ncbi:sensor histidine kinase [Candidatus Solirubrobacter pratensis]|uniref:sensor histidine kinase n=1 Tax=Candidatus Solirubrobacter pratensis TaxID=1298857 RepID=UPI0004112AD2|nr:HAMP domain-containing sensor histidine kinase [Candidatus Solirubrobacter pratensis]
MIVSLRGRLVAGVLALAAAGLIVLAAVTYAEQRSFLLEGVDRQVRSAQAVVDNVLEGKPFDPHGGFGHDGARRGPPPGEGPAPGTYVQRRPRAGPWEGRFVGYDAGGTPPDLPSSLPLDRIVTVSAGGTSYRVLAHLDPQGDTNVVAVPLHSTNQTLNRLLLVEGLVIAGVLLLLGLFAWIVVRVGLLPLDRMGHTAAAIAGGDLSHRVETTDPRSEVGRLGMSLNAMLDRLEEAFEEREASQERLRAFIADASHELRTPLASIRGYAELYRMGAARSEQDVRKAMRRIENEGARMGVLVEDLLTLARLDELREAPHAPVDMAKLARDAVDDARATAPDRDIALHVERPAEVLGDADQLRQVLANLLRNALVHTPPGTPVEVSVVPGVRIEVRDHGPGLPTDDSDALFERFWRAEGGRERGKGGAGLGLAIVAGIVSAHGGFVSASNAPGGGASFVVELPQSGR